MKTEVKKGTEILSLEVKDENLIAVLSPNALPEDLDEEKLVEEALLSPIGTSRLRDIVHAGETVAIITSDNTRPVPTWKIMPAVLKELYEAGVCKEDITLYFARGSHRAMNDEERRHLAGGQAYSEIACLDSDTEHVTYVGTTKRGTRVEYDTRIVEADRRICIGNVEYHYFAGFSGGAKAIFPGMSTPASIAMNHSHMVEEGSKTANLEGNPVREDLEEACDMVGADFIVNAVLNTKKQIIGVYCGDVREAHRAACRSYDSIYRSPIAKKAEIVIVSQGGAPKDLNLYQTQKALDNAGHAVADGGVIIVCGSCAEGFGQKIFEEWMLRYQNPEEMMEELRKNFVLGAHKACAIAAIRRKAEIWLVSDMDPAIVSRTFLKPYDSLEHAFADAMERYGEHAGVIVMPYGGSTLPKAE